MGASMPLHQRAYITAALSANPDEWALTNQHLLAQHPSSELSSTVLICTLTRGASDTPTSLNT